MSQAMYAGRFSDARHSLEETVHQAVINTLWWHYRDDNMGTVSVFRDDLEPVNRLLVPDDIIQDLRPVLFYPRRVENPRKSKPEGRIPW